MERMDIRIQSRHFWMPARATLIVLFTMGTWSSMWSSMSMAQEAAVPTTPPTTSETAPISKIILKRLQRYESFLRRFDTNLDNVIDPAEVDPEQRRFYQGIARHAGLDATGSISLSQWREALLRRYQIKTESTGSTAVVGHPKAGESLVPGFGVEEERSQVPGFGESDETRKTSKTPTTSESKSSKAKSRYGYSRTSHRHSHASTTASKTASKTVSKRSEMEYKVRRYAESLLKRYDTNKSGVLERDEWSKMRTDPKSTDRNNDKVITLEELAAKLIDYSRRKSSWKKTTPSSHSGSHDRDKARHPSYRQRSPHERLPEGLPDWFAEQDDNADGQISMAEYSSRWSDETLVEFTRLDCNSDGVITSSECLKTKEE